MSRTAKMIGAALAVFVLVGGGIVLGMNWNSWFGRAEPEVPAATVDENAETYTGDKATYTGEKNTDTIDIPGFESINLKADVSGQSVNLYNPQQNTCYFRMSLLLADGTVLWQSGLVEPGMALYSLTLQETLAAGDYTDAVLKYECFAMDEAQTPLNGSEIKLTLHVLE